VTAPFGFSRVVFLSHVIDADTPVFPGDPPGRIPQHTGPAAAHFHAGQPSADELDPGDFFRPRTACCLTLNDSSD